MYPKAAKFVNQSKTDRSMMLKKPMSLADLNALARIKKETLAIDKKMNKSKSQARTNPPIIMKNDVVNRA